MRFDMRSGTWVECDGMVEGATIGSRLSLDRLLFDRKEQRPHLIATSPANAPYKCFDEVAIVVTYDGAGSVPKPVSIDWGRRKTLESVE